MLGLSLKLAYCLLWNLVYSIEDPFEIWYDVAHVVKAPQMAYLRKEFLVSVSDESAMAWAPSAGLIDNHFHD